MGHSLNCDIARSQVRHSVSYCEPWVEADIRFCQYPHENTRDSGFNATHHSCHWRNSKNPGL